MLGEFLPAKMQNAQKANLYYLQQTCPILIRSTLTLTNRNRSFHLLQITNNMVTVKKSAEISVFRVSKNRPKFLKLIFIPLRYLLDTLNFVSISKYVQ
eukprot:sb/3478836/